ncbi:MAG: GNAT family N-acetyltransferase [Candidatus Ranarchaeia archaeon]|jgi:ribosomal protein S18 acetylase RimI-like enzyme
MATLEDVRDLVRLRRVLFEDMGFEDSSLLDELDHAVSTYLTKTIPTDQFFGWVAETSTGKIVGSGGVVINQYPPEPNNLQGKSGYIMNIATARSHRHQGIARTMMKTILDWLKRIQIPRAKLYTTPVARALYEDLGFTKREEMQLELD